MALVGALRLRLRRRLPWALGTMFEALLKAGKWLFIAILITIVIIVFFGKGITKFAFHELPFMGTTFTTVEWEKAGYCEGKLCMLDISCPRGGMFRDLQRNHLLTGTPRPLVEQMLGKSDVADRKNCVIYPLGMCSGARIDMDYLHICYNNKNRITSVSHYQS
jgi:hypothetical protein